MPVGLGHPNGGLRTAASTRDVNHLGVDLDVTQDRERLNSAGRLRSRGIGVNNTRVRRRFTHPLMVTGLIVGQVAARVRSGSHHLVRHTCKIVPNRPTFPADYVLLRMKRLSRGSNTARWNIYLQAED